MRDRTVRIWLRSLRAWISGETCSNAVRSSLFFSVLLRCFSIEFCQNIFAYGRRSPLEISTGTGVSDHAESEYVIFIHRILTLQNSTGVICGDQKMSVTHQSQMKRQRSPARTTFSSKWEIDRSLRQWKKSARGRHSTVERKKQISSNCTVFSLERSYWQWCIFFTSMRNDPHLIQINSSFKFSNETMWIWPLWIGVQLLLILKKMGLSESEVAKQVFPSFHLFFLEICSSEFRFNKWFPSFNKKQPKKWKKSKLKLKKNLILKKVV